MARDLSKEQPERRLRAVRDDDGNLQRVVLEPTRPPLAPAWSEVDAASRHLDARRPRVPQPEPPEPQVPLPRAPEARGTRSFPAPGDEDATPLAPAWGGEPPEPDETDEGPTEVPEQVDTPEDAPTLDGPDGTPLAPAWRSSTPAPRRVGDATHPRVPALAPTEPAEAEARDPPTAGTPLAPAWESWKAPTRSRLTGTPRVPEHRPGFVVLEHRIRGTGAGDELEVETHVTLPRARDHARPSRGSLEAGSGNGDATPLAPAWASLLGVEQELVPEEPEDEVETPHVRTDIQVMEVHDTPVPQLETPEAAEPAPEPREPARRVIQVPHDLPAVVDEIVRRRLVPREPVTHHEPQEPPLVTEVPPAPDLPPQSPMHQRIDDLVEAHLQRLREAAAEEDEVPQPPVAVGPAPDLPDEHRVSQRVDELLAQRAPWRGADGDHVPEDVGERVDAVLARHEDA